MKILSRILSAILIPLSLLAFAACGDDDYAEVAYQGGNTFGYQGQPTGPVTPQYGAAYGEGTVPGGLDSGPGTSVDPAPGLGPQAPSNAGPTAPTAPAPGPGGTPAYPKGIPVPGKPGFVMSPYTKPDQGYVDVRGYPPGMEVKDPYTGGVFLVP